MRNQAKAALGSFFSNIPVFHHSNLPFSSALPLLVPRVGADHPDDAFAPDDFAILTQLLN